MRAEIIAIGDELTSGQRLDTNSQWLSQQLGDIGVPTRFHTTVADDLEANVEVFRRAVARADVVLCTGGLGPTADDLTREAMAKAFQLDLELHADSLARIQEMFTSRGRAMPERNRVQALFPRGAAAIVNPHGTAPGIDLIVDQGSSTSRIFALPGVPAEMKEMWQQSVRPALLGQRGEESSVVRHFSLKCFGAGESDLEAMLPDLIRRGREPAVGITVSKATITLRVTAHAKDEQACGALIDPVVREIRDCLGDLVFGVGEEQLQHAVTQMLAARRQTVAVVEWGSCGVIANWLCSLPEAKDVFRGAAVVSDNASAERMLGVDPRMPPPEHTKALAAAIKTRCAADYGLAVGDFPKLPGRDSKVFIGLASDSGVRVAGRRFAGHPDILKERAAKQALDVLRLYLLDTTRQKHES